jgi:hypothetical protein
VGQSSRLRKDCSLYEEGGEESLTLQGSSISVAHYPNHANEALKRAYCKFIILG